MISNVIRLKSKRDTMFFIPCASSLFLGFLHHYTWHGTVTAYNQIENEEKARFLLDLKTLKGTHAMCWQLAVGACFVKKQQQSNPSFFFLR